MRAKSDAMCAPPATRAGWVLHSRARGGWARGDGRREIEMLQYSSRGTPVTENRMHKFAALARTASLLLDGWQLVV